MTESQTATFLDQLRTVTSESHKNLESLPLSASILSPQISKSDYAHYLDIMLDVTQETESRIYPIVADLFPDIEERKKAPYLRDDLKTLGTSKTDFQQPFASQKTMSVPFALGIFYVVEGSTLGGRFILKNINEALGYDHDNGAKYFSGYGNKTGVYWKNFLNVLTRYEEQNNAADEIIAGADYAFQAIHDHFLARS